MSLQQKKSYAQEIIDAINRYKELAALEEPYNSEREQIEKEMESRFNSITKPSEFEGGKGFRAMEYMFLNMEVYEAIVNIIKGKYETDPSIITPERRGEILQLINDDERIKKKILDSLEKYKDNRPSNPNKRNDFVNYFIDKTLRMVELDREQSLKFTGERLGVHYALVNAISKQTTLPDELKGEYKDVADYVEKNKAAVNRLVTEAIKTYSKTPTQSEVLQALLRTAVFDKIALVDGRGIEQMKDSIRKAIESDEENGLVNPNATRYHNDGLQQILSALKRGVDFISIGNNTNTMFLHKDGEFYQGSTVIEASIR